MARDWGWDGFQDLEWVWAMMSAALTASIALCVKFSESVEVNG